MLDAYDAAVEDAAERLAAWRAARPETKVRSPSGSDVDILDPEEIRVRFDRWAQDNNERIHAADVSAALPHVRRGQAMLEFASAGGHARAAKLRKDLAAPRRPKIIAAVRQRQTEFPNEGFTRRCAKVAEDLGILRGRRSRKVERIAHTAGLGVHKDTISR